MEDAVYEGFAHCAMAPWVTASEKLRVLGTVYEGGKQEWTSGKVERTSGWWAAGKTMHNCAELRHRDQVFVPTPPLGTERELSQKEKGSSFLIQTARKRDSA